MYTTDVNIDDIGEIKEKTNMLAIVWSSCLLLV